MANPPIPDPTAQNHAPVAPPPAPKWVKVFGVALGTLVLLVVVMIVHGTMGGHGPFRHGQ